MRAEEGKRVTIRFICRLEDGTVYDVSDRDTLEFIIGQGNTLPTLEKGVIGMQPGDHRAIVVPAAEAEEFPFDQEEAPTEAHFPAGVSRPPIGYEFGPGDEGDDVLLAHLRGPPLSAVLHLQALTSHSMSM